MLQNLAEAEYTVAVFMYMRLLGYPADRISILTTYNGQKHLIRDVLAQRCGNNPLIGFPLKVSVTQWFLTYEPQPNIEWWLVCFVPRSQGEFYQSGIFNLTAPISAFCFLSHGKKRAMAGHTGVMCCVQIKIRSSHSWTIF